MRLNFKMILGALGIWGLVVWSIFSFDTLFSSNSDTSNKPQAIQEFDENNCEMIWDKKNGKKIPPEASEKNVPSKEIQRKLQSKRAKTKNEFLNQYGEMQVITPVESQQQETITLKQEGTLFLFFSQYRFNCGGQDTIVHGVEVTIEGHGTQEPRSPRTEFVKLARQPLPEGTQVSIQRTMPSELVFNKGGEIWNLDTYHPPKLVLVPTKDPFPWGPVIGISFLSVLGGTVIGGLLFSKQSKKQQRSETTKAEEQDLVKKETPQESQSDKSDVQEGAKDDSKEKQSSKDQMSKNSPQNKRTKRMDEDKGPSSIRRRRKRGRNS